MTTADMLQKVQTALATDVEFVRYCVDTLGGAPTIQIDFDEEQELELDYYPFIGLLTASHTGDIHQRENIFIFRAIAATRKGDINSATQTVDLGGTTASVKTRTYAGRLQAENLREQAISALYRAKLGKVSVESKAFENTHHPKFYSPFTLTIEERI